MIRATAADSGRDVIFHLFRGARPEHGVVVGVKGQWVMVKYDHVPTPLATRPEALEWADGYAAAHAASSDQKPTKRERRHVSRHR